MKKILFLLILLLLTACNSEQVIQNDEVVFTQDTVQKIQPILGLSDCGSSPYSVYGEQLFADPNDIYEAKVFFHYILGEDEPERFNSSYLPEFINTFNEEFEEARIRLRNGKTEIIEVPEEEADIKYFEKHKLLYSKRGYINVFIYPSTIGNYSGIAGGIPSRDMAIKEHYMQSKFTTGTHEGGHMFGLRHTHTYDISENDSWTSGDLICGLIRPEFVQNPNNTGYLGLVDKDCNYTGELGEYTLEQHNELVRNHMSYSHCRSEFVPAQIELMHFMINNAQDLKECFTKA